MKIELIVHKSRNLVFYFKLATVTTILSLAFVFPLIFLQSCSDEENYPTGDVQIIQAVDQLKSDSLRSYVAWLVALQPRFMLAGNQRNIAYKIHEKFKDFGFSQTEIDSFDISAEYDGNSYDTRQYNILATITGNRRPDSICIVAAHYDSMNEEINPFSVSPGADDNGSGMAAMFEIARCIRTTLPNPGYTVRFIAFAGEELDFYGSTRYAEAAKKRGEKIKFMLNIDMIGYSSESNSKDWYINIMNYNNSKDLLQTAQRICYQYSGLSAENNNKYSDEGDSYPFFQQGFKSLFFNEPVDNPYYHTQNDLIANLNFSYCREVTKIPYAMLLEANQ